MIRKYFEKLSQHRTSIKLNTSQNKEQEYFFMQNDDVKLRLHLNIILNPAHIS